MPRPSRLGLGRDESTTLRVRVPNKLRKEWDTYCATYGETTAQEGLRAVLGFLVSQPGDVQDGLAALIQGVMRQQSHPVRGLAPTKTADVGETVDRGKKRRVEIQYTPSEYRQLEAIARDRECSVQFWISSLTRAALTKGITVGASELKALGELNYQLMAIGRNLNQIAHQINVDPAKHLHALRVEAIAAVGAKIDEGRKLTHALVAACSHRWELH